MLTDARKEEILGKDFLVYADKILTDKNFNNFTKSWIIDYIASFQEMLKVFVGKELYEFSPNAIINRIARNLSADINSEIPCKMFDKIKYYFFTQGVYHVTEFGDGYIYLQDRLKPIERIKCALKSDMPYPMSSERYSYIMRHELSHCANSDFEIIDTQYRLQQLALKIENSKRMKDRVKSLSEYKFFQMGKKYIVSATGMEINDLSQMLIGVNLDDLEEGIDELEQTLILRAINSDYKPKNDYALNLYTAKHIAKMVGVCDTLRCRLHHNFSELNHLYNQVTGIDLKKVIFMLNKINERSLVDDDGKFNTKSDFINWLLKIEKDNSLKVHRNRLEECK